MLSVIMASVFMLIVANKPFVLSVIMLNVVAPNLALKFIVPICTLRRK